MDHSSIQRSLAGLQERFNDLRDQAESRFAVLVAERDAEVNQKEEARRQVEELKLLLAKKELETKHSSERVELLLLQLHQVQEELDRYFLLYRKQSEILHATQRVSGKAIELFLSANL